MKHKILLGLLFFLINGCKVFSSTTSKPLNHNASVKKNSDTLPTKTANLHIKTENSSKFADNELITVAKEKSRLPSLNINDSASRYPLNKNLGLGIKSSLLENHKIHEEAIKICNKYANKVSYFRDNDPYFKAKDPYVKYTDFYFKDKKHNFKHKDQETDFISGRDLYFQENMQQQQQRNYENMQQRQERHEEEVFESCYNQYINHVSASTLAKETDEKFTEWVKNLEAQQKEKHHPPKK